MRPNFELNYYASMGSVVGSGGTVTSVGTAVAGTIEPFPTAFVAVGQNAAGAIVCTLQSSAALASGYTDIATVAAGSLAGIYATNAGTAMTGQYLRTVVTSTGGTANVVAGFLGKPRTITS